MDPKQAIAKDIKKEIKSLQDQIRQMEELLENGGDLKDLEEKKHK